MAERGRGGEEDKRYRRGGGEPTKPPTEPTEPTPPPGNYRREPKAPATPSTGDLNGVINAALSFINSHLSGSIKASTINAGATPSLNLWGDCYFLDPPPSIPNIASNAYGYLLYWKAKGANACWGGASYGSGTNGKTTATIPYDTSYFFTPGGWDGIMSTGTEITIHELHHVLMTSLKNVGYPESRSKGAHVYGRTVPHLDYMSAFGYGSGDDKKFTAWAYEQITSEMMSKLPSTTLGIAVYNGTTPPTTPPPPTVTKEVTFISKPSGANANIKVI